MIIIIILNWLNGYIICVEMCMFVCVCSVFMLSWCLSLRTHHAAIVDCSSPAILCHGQFIFTIYYIYWYICRAMWKKNNFHKIRDFSVSTSVTIPKSKTVSKEPARRIFDCHRRPRTNFHTFRMVYDEYLCTLCEVECFGFLVCIFSTFLGLCRIR